MKMLRLNFRGEMVSVPDSLMAGLKESKFVKLIRKGEGRPRVGEAAGIPGSVEKVPVSPTPEQAGTTSPGHSGVFVNRSAWGFHLVLDYLEEGKSLLP